MTVLSSMSARKRNVVIVYFPRMEMLPVKIFVAVLTVFLCKSPKKMCCRKEYKVYSIQKRVL